MNKAIGILVIGLGLILVVIGIQGSQSQVLASIKNINPTLRNATTGAGTGSSSGGINSNPMKPLFPSLNPPASTA